MRLEILFDGQTRMRRFGQAVQAAIHVFEA